MISEHKTLTLFDKVVLEKMVIKVPVSMDISMHNEACFYYNKTGHSHVFSETNKGNTQPKETSSCSFFG